MTLCKRLAAGTLPDGKMVEAWERTDKNAVAPRYEVVISRDGISMEVIPAARTTWEKKYSAALGKS